MGALSFPKGRVMPFMKTNSVNRFVAFFVALLRFFR